MQIICASRFGKHVLPPIPASTEVTECHIRAATPCSGRPPERKFASEESSSNFGSLLSVLMLCRRLHWSAWQSTSFVCSCRRESYFCSKELTEFSKLRSCTRESSLYSNEVAKTTEVIRNLTYFFSSSQHSRMRTEFTERREVCNGKVTRDEPKTKLGLAIQFLGNRTFPKKEIIMSNKSFALDEADVVRVST